MAGEEIFDVQSPNNSEYCQKYRVDFPCWEDHQQQSGRTGMISGTIIAAFIVIANCILFSGIVFSKKRSQRFYQWVLSLSILDVLFGLTLLITTVISHPEDQGSGCENFTLALFWITFNGSASFYNCVGLNIERMSAVRWPEHYDDQVGF